MTVQSEIVRKLNTLAKCRARIERHNAEIRKLVATLPEGQRVLTNLAKDSTIADRLAGEIRTEVVLLETTVRGQDLTASFYSSSYGYDRGQIDQLLARIKVTHPDIAGDLEKARKPRKAYATIG